MPQALVQLLPGAERLEQAMIFNFGFCPVWALRARRWLENRLCPRRWFCKRIRVCCDSGGVPLTGPAGKGIPFLSENFTFFVQTLGKPLFFRLVQILLIGAKEAQLGLIHLFHSQSLEKQ